MKALRDGGSVNAFLARALERYANDEDASILERQGRSLDEIDLIVRKDWKEGGKQRTAERRESGTAAWDRAAIYGERSAPRRGKRGGA